MFDLLRSVSACTIAILANDPNVNVEETMGSVRHSSLAATCAYVVCGNDSETMKLSALGFQLQG